MDYDNFKKEYNKYEEWMTERDDFLCDRYSSNEQKKDGSYWLRLVEKYHDEIPPVNNDGEITHPYEQKDMVNSPAHYTRGTQEAIDIIEEAIQDAPDVKAGMLQAQALKYLLRLWLKGNAPQDSKKAQWYLNRLIEHLSATLKE